jgi:hypothetical protein
VTCLKRKATCAALAFALDEGDFRLLVGNLRDPQRGGDHLT